MYLNIVLKYEKKNIWSRSECGGTMFHTARNSACNYVLTPSMRIFQSKSV
jgi:hypothetical protein